VLTNAAQSEPKTTFNSSITYSALISKGSNILINCYSNFYNIKDTFDTKMNQSEQMVVLFIGMVISIWVALDPIRQKNRKPKIFFFTLVFFAGFILTAWWDM